MIIGGGGSPTSIYVVSGVFGALCWTMVAARCYVRHVLLKAFSKEDWLAVVSLLGFTVMLAFNVMIGMSGSGSHMVDLTHKKQADGLMWWWALEEVYIPTSALVKASVACVCLRLVDKRIEAVALKASIVAMIAYSLVFLCLNTFQCYPVNLFWLKALGADTTNKCEDPSFIGELQLMYSAVNAFADCAYSLTSCALVWKLHLPTGGYKWSVFIVLSFGIIACLAVIIRLPFLVSLKIGLMDFLYYTTHVANMSTVEIGLGIIAAAGSSLRPLLRTIVSRSKFIGTSVDPTSTRWNRKRDEEGYVRSGAVSRVLSDTGKLNFNNPRNDYAEVDIEKFELKSEDRNT